jgi:signal transduction histidine kinase
MDSHETSIYIAVLITSLVLGCVIVYFAVSIFRQQRSYIHLQRKFFGEEVDVLEQERRRVAHDLHDEVGPLLSLTKSHISEVKAKGEREALHIDKTNQYLVTAMERMEQIAINITPSSLTKKGLFFSVEEFFNDVKEVHPLVIVFKYEVKGSIELNRSLHLYRIVQELTHNTIKHAQARDLYVHFKERNQKLYLFYSDNGKGFESGASKSNGGLGKGSLRNRCEILYGKMNVYSKKNKGTEYFFEFPMEIK